MIDMDKMPKNEWMEKYRGSWFKDSEEALQGVVLNAIKKQYFWMDRENPEYDELDDDESVFKSLESVGETLRNVLAILEWILDDLEEDV